MNPFAPGTVDGIPATVRYDFASNTFSLVPASKLKGNTKYEGVLVATDLAGNHTISYMSFTTGPDN